MPLSEARAHLVPSPGYRLTDPGTGCFAFEDLRMQHIVRSQVRKDDLGLSTGETISLKTQALTESHCPGPCEPLLLGVDYIPEQALVPTVWLSEGSPPYLLLEKSAGVTHMEGSFGDNHLVQVL